MSMMPRVALAATAMALAAAAPSGAQETLARTTNLSGGWIGQNGILYASVPYRLTTVETAGGRDVSASPTFELALGLPWNLLAGARFAPSSPTVPGDGDEWEVFARHHTVASARGAPLDVALAAGFNGPAGSFDGEVSVARWLGPIRLLGAGRAMSDGYGTGDARFALAAGVVVHPAPGSIPVALAADLGSLVDRRGDERVAWSAAVQLGLSFTDHTLSLFATNTGSSTLQGVSRGGAGTRYGFDITIPVPAGRFLGWFVPREQAMDAVVEVTEPVERVHRAEATRYQFFPGRIEIERGTVVEWTNTDDVVHTVSAENGAWDSGAIRPGERWRARFDSPGIYPFLCGPHPFMKGVVIVR